MSTKSANIQLELIKELKTKQKEFAFKVVKRKKPVLETGDLFLKLSK